MGDGSRLDAKRVWHPLPSANEGFDHLQGDRQSTGRLDPSWPRQDREYGALSRDRRGGHACPCRKHRDLSPWAPVSEREPGTGAWGIPAIRCGSRERQLRSIPDIKACRKISSDGVSDLISIRQGSPCFRLYTNAQKWRAHRVLGGITCRLYGKHLFGDAMTLGQRVQICIPTFSMALCACTLARLRNLADVSGNAFIRDRRAAIVLPSDAKGEDGRRSRFGR